MADEKSETRVEFPDTPAGWARRWSIEFAAEEKAHKEWRERGRTVEAKYGDDKGNALSRLNLFHGDIETRKAVLYGNTPRVRVRRRFADADDEEGRVSAEMMSRMLNTDIERDEDGFQTSLEMARDDRLLPGLGVVRLRYVVEWEDIPEQPAKLDPTTGAELAPAVPAGKRKSREDVETDYVRWEDYRWSPCRFWNELRWEAFPAEMTKEALHKRFDSSETLGPDAALLIDKIPLNAKERKEGEKGEDPWARARVWEVWCKEGREVFWYVEGFDLILDRKKDPLGLDGFWPNTRPMFANVTSKALVPTPDYCISQDPYDEVDKYTAKIAILMDAIRVTGVYDASSPEVVRILTETGANKLYPAQNMAALVDKGGMEKVISYFPLEPIIQAIEVLTAKRAETIQLLHQSNGLPDIVRGEQMQRETATTSRIKGRAFSIRTQAGQKEFAKFATETQRIRAEIIAKWFDPETIVERSNVLRTPDADKAPAAASLIKSQFGQYRIEVAGEDLGLTDLDAVKAERIEFFQAVTGSLKEIAEIGTVAPWAVPHLLKLIKHGVSAFPGAEDLEGTFDTMVSAADQTAQQAQAAAEAPKGPDPALVKAQADVEKTGMEIQAARERHQMDSVARREEFGMRMAELAEKRATAAEMPSVPEVPGGVA